MTSQVEKEIVEITPIPPDTVDSVRAEIEGDIKRLLEKEGKDNLLTDKKLSVKVEKPFPSAEVVHIAFTLLSGVALETFKTVILPWLKNKYETRQQASTKNQK